MPNKINKPNQKEEVLIRKNSRYRDLPIGWQNIKIKYVMKRVKNIVSVEKDKTYREIGIKSHGKGIFYKEEITGEALGNKAVFWVEPYCFIVNIVFAWELAVAKTTTDGIGLITSHRFPMYKPIKDKLNFGLYYIFF